VLGRPFDPDAAFATAVAAALRVGAGAPTQPLRVRLELAEDGTCRAAAQPHHDAEAGDGPLLVVWSDVPVTADDPARRHKSSDRAPYDAASAWARRVGVADVLFVNDHGRVAEGAISNVFVRAPDGRWRTPPVHDGALPGVLRAEMLRAGTAFEGALRPDDLRSGGLAIGNALRGLRPVALDERRRWRPGVAAEAGA